MSVDSIANEIPMDIDKRTRIFLYFEQKLSGDTREFPFSRFLSYRSVPFDSSYNKNTTDRSVHISVSFFTRNDRFSLLASGFRVDAFYSECFVDRVFDDSRVHIWVVDLRPALSSPDTRRSRSL